MTPFESPGSAQKPRHIYVATAKERLHEAGLRWTRARKLVVETIASAERPLNAYGVRSQLLEAGQQVDVVTVYRTLAALVEAGLVHWVGVAEGYVACRIEHTHQGLQQYVYCPQCGLVREIPMDDASVAAVVQSCGPLGEPPTSISLEVAVKCGDCAHEAKEKGFRLAQWP